MKDQHQQQAQKKKQKKQHRDNNDSMTRNPHHRWWQQQRQYVPPPPTPPFPYWHRPYAAAMQQPPLMFPNSSSNGIGNYATTGYLPHIAAPPLPPPPPPARDPKAEKARRDYAIEWLQSFQDLYGYKKSDDGIGTTYYVHPCFGARYSIYRLYEEECCSNKETTAVDVKIFYRLWDTNFSNLTIDTIDTKDGEVFSSFYYADDKFMPFRELCKSLGTIFLMDFTTGKTTPGSIKTGKASAKSTATAATTKTTAAATAAKSATAKVSGSDDEATIEKDDATRKVIMDEFFPAISTFQHTLHWDSTHETVDFAWLGGDTSLSTNFASWVFRSRLSDKTGCKKQLQGMVQNGTIDEIQNCIVKQLADSGKICGINTANDENDGNASQRGTATIKTTVDFMKSKIGKWQSPHVDFQRSHLGGKYDPEAAKKPEHVAKYTRMYFGIAPLSTDGSFLQVWDRSKPDHPGILIFIPYGKMLFVRSDMIHGGGFCSKNSINNNLRIQIYFYFDVENPKMISNDLKDPFTNIPYENTLKKAKCLDVRNNPYWKEWCTKLFGSDSVKANEGEEKNDD